LCENNFTDYSIVNWSVGLLSKRNLLKALEFENVCFKKLKVCYRLRLPQLLVELADISLAAVEKRQGQGILRIFN